MLLLISKAHPTIARLHAAHPNVGRLAVPRDSYRIRDTAEAGIPWAADNAAFSSFDRRAWLGMLDRLAGVPGCLFVVAPDVVADAEATLQRFAGWEPSLRARDLPAALAAQDGLTPDAVPWDAIAALFVGGSTEFKMGAAARLLVAEANERGKWTHMGRVNTLQRIRYARAIGCRSVDGSSFSRWTQTHVGRAARAVAAPPNLMLEEPALG